MAPAACCAASRRIWRWPVPFPVIGSGSRIPGTQLNMLSEEAPAAMNAADVIISKGMGNCETLKGCGYPVCYALLIKSEPKRRIAPLFLAALP